MRSHPTRALFVSLIACSSSPASTDAGADAGRDAGVMGPREITGVTANGWIEALAFSSDGATLWAAAEAQVNGATGEARAFDFATGAPKTTVQGPAWSLSIGSPGVLVGGKIVEVVDPSSGQPTRTIMGAQGASAISRDGKWIAAAMPAMGQVQIFDAQTGMMIAAVAHATVTNERIWRVVFSPDGSLLVTASGQNGLGSPHGAAHVWKTSDWTEAAAITCTTFDAAFSPDGSELALACWLTAQVVPIKDLTSAKMLPVAMNTSSMSIAFSPDGSKIAVGALSGGVQVFRAQDLTRIADLPEPKPTTVKALAFSPDGRFLAGGGWDDAIVRVWPSP